MRDIWQEIQDKLDEIEKKENVRILHAVESGSRSWGFASPDSDYDVRFIYVRQKEDYLRIDDVRDVIEYQLDEVLDINGWDLKKALKQFARGNATLFEWSGSPVVYRTTPEWEKISEAGRLYFSEKTAICHYYGTARSTYQEYLQGDLVRYKKYFYALRPLLAARYIETFHQAPPVLFDDLLKQELPAELKKAIDELVEIKKQTTEKEENPQMPVIREFLQKELERQKEISENLPNDHRKDLEALNEIYREMTDPLSLKKEQKNSDIAKIRPGDSYMRIAIEEAYAGIRARHGGPFGAVVVKDGRIVGRGHNRVLSLYDPTCHGEVAAIRNACKNLMSHDLSGCVIYTTGEPCPMCLYACLWAKIDKIYYGCTIADNSLIGFRDEDMDHLGSGRDQLPDYLECIDRDACLKLFEDYLQMDHEIY